MKKLQGLKGQMPILFSINKPMPSWCSVKNVRLITYLCLATAGLLSIVAAIQVAIGQGVAGGLYGILTGIRVTVGIGLACIVALTVDSILQSRQARKAGK